MRSLLILYITLFYFENSISQNFKSTIMYLASDSLHGRAPGTNDELLAQRYITKQLTKQFKIELQSFNFLQDSIEKKSATNIIAYSKKNNEEDSVIILMAHYDGLGKSSSKSLEILASKKKHIHNGADDNSSGVAMIIELGKYLSKQKHLKYNIILLFTSAHEYGLFGAKHYCNTIASKYKIKSVYNFDMVGRLGITSTLFINDNNIDSTSYCNSNHLNFNLNNTIPNSDLTSFIPFKIHLVNITTGTHTDYHKHTDDEEKINYNGMKIIYAFLIDFIKNLNHYA